MNITRFPGGFYVDALPSGAYCVLFPTSHIQTHQGTIAFPPGEAYGPMFLHCSEVGGFHFAGLAHEKVGTMREWWIGKGWGESPAVFGRFVYGRQGEILDVLPAGYQYLRDDTGEPIPRTYTYGPRNGLSEWLVVGDLQIGQGHDSIAPAGQGGVLLWDGKVHRILESGQCTFINAHRDGEKVAISFCKPDGAVIVQTTVSELRALPVYTPVTQQPPVPVPQPPKPEEPKPVSTPNRLDIVKAVAAQYPELVKLNSKIACGQLTECIAQALHLADAGWGLLSKSAGENNYRGHAVDAVIYQPTQQVIDLMSGAGDRDLLKPDSSEADRKAFDHDIRVKWDEVGKRPDNNWMQPFQPEGTPPQPPPQVPPFDPIPLDPGPSDIAASLAVMVLALGHLRAGLDDLRERHAIEVTARMEFEKKVDAQLGVVVPTVVEHAARKPPSYRGKLGMTISLDPQL